MNLDLVELEDVWVFSETFARTPPMSTYVNTMLQQRAGGGAEVVERCFSTSWESSCKSVPENLH